MPKVIFQHPQIGTLITENGIDSAQWAYGLNTQTFPTYGGEVVQILSVYIDNLTITGTVSTYAQMEAIYQYFASYLRIATQGSKRTSAATATGTTDGPAYNLQPIVFTYPERQWSFHLYPISLPGFHIGHDVVAPTWQVECFVVDDSPDLGLIYDGIRALAVSGKTADQPLDTFTITGNISPDSGDPNTNPFQTYDQPIAEQQKVIDKYGSYYNSLISTYNTHDFAALTGVLGSKPSLGKTTTQRSNSTVKIPKKP